MGKSSQRKGREGERELCSYLQSSGYDVTVGQAMSFGKMPDLSGLPGIHIECKRVERLNVQEAMQQAINDAEKFNDGKPALFHRRNRSEWLVTMRLVDWLNVYGESKTNTCEQIEHLQASAASASKSPQDKDNKTIDKDKSARTRDARRAKPKKPTAFFGNPPKAKKSEIKRA